MARGDLEDLQEQAQRILNNPVVQKCFDHMEKEIVDAMASLRLTDEASEVEAVALLRDLQAKRRLQKKLMVASKATNFKNQGAD